jgi:hypothetical protein
MGIFISGSNKPGNIEELSFISFTLGCIKTA